MLPVPGPAFSAAVPAAGDPSRLPVVAGRRWLFGCLVASSVGSCRRPFVCFQASRAAGLLCCRSCCRGSFQASSCRRGYAAGAGPPSLLPVCFQASSCRRSGAAAGIYFYNFNLFLCCRGIFFFWDPVKLPGIEALYQTIYNYNIYKTIQDHFFKLSFLASRSKDPTCNFFIAGNALFLRLPGISAKYF